MEHRGTRTGRLTATEVRQKEQEPNSFYYPFVDWKITHNFSPPRILTNSLLVEDAEDWSRVRSPSRARRRMKQGHRQNVRIIQVPSESVIHDRQNNVMYCHPEVYQKIRDHVDAELNRMVSRIGRSPVFSIFPETVNLPSDVSIKKLTDMVDAVDQEVRTLMGFDQFINFYNLGDQS